MNQEEQKFNEFMAEVSKESKKLWDKYTTSPLTTNGNSFNTLSLWFGHDGYRRLWSR